jgi:chitinase
MRRVFGVVIILLLMASPLWAVTLMWDAPLNSQVDGYKLYYGQSMGLYDTVLDAGPATSTSVGGLQSGATYFFAATAYNVAGESAYSNEVSYTEPPPPPPSDTTPPTVSITSPPDGATVQRKSTIEIRASGADDVGVMQIDIMINGQLFCSWAGAAGSCSWQVPNPPGRTYQLQARAYDAAGNVGLSSIVTVRSN